MRFAKYECCRGRGRESITPYPRLRDRLPCPGRVQEGARARRVLGNSQEKWLSGRDSRAQSAGVSRGVFQKLLHRRAFKRKITTAVRFKPGPHFLFQKTFSRETRPYSVS